MIDNNKVEYYEHTHRKKFSLRLFGVLVFILILLILLFTAFGDSGGTITGNVIANGLRISTDLNVIPLELENSFNRIEIQGSYNTYLSVGGERFDLSKSNNFIIMEGLQGSVSTDGKTINSIKGNAQRVSINGVPIMPESTSLLSVKIEDFKFRSLEIDDGVYIRDVSFNATGTVGVEDNTLILNDDILRLQKFYGSLVIEENSMKLVGDIEGINTEGKSKVSISN